MNLGGMVGGDIGLKAGGLCVKLTVVSEFKMKLCVPRYISPLCQPHHPFVKGVLTIISGTFLV